MIDKWEKERLDANKKTFQEDKEKEEESVEQLRITHVSLSNQLDYAKNMVKLSNSVMKLLLGISLEKPLELTDNLEGLVLKRTTLETVDSGYENNIDLRIAENKIITEELMYRLEKAKSLPSLTAFVNGAYMGNNESFSFTEKAEKIRMKIILQTILRMLNL